MGIFESADPAPIIGAGWLNAGDEIEWQAKRSEIVLREDIHFNIVRLYLRDGRRIECHFDHPILRTKMAPLDY